MGLPTTHTAGPWKASEPERLDTGWQALRITDEHGVSDIAEAYVYEGDEANGLANARLIAAAPAMYDALKACEPFLFERLGDGHGTGLIPAWAAVVDALKLARGEGVEA